MPDYSQYGQQRILTEHFGDRKGFLIDVGAGDGINLSNSRALLEQGWRGVLVEPHRELFKELVKNTIGVVDAVPINVAFADGNGAAKLHLSPPGADTDHTLMIRDHWDSYEVRVCRLDSLFPFKIDLLLVDAEGLDYAVLLGVDWTVNRPEVVVAEGVMNGEPVNCFEITELMKANGYGPLGEGKFLHGIDLFFKLLDD